MASKKKRHQARKMRQNRARDNVPTFDIHAQHLADSLESLDALVARFAGMDDAVAAMGDGFDAALAEFVAGLKDFEPHRLIEVARMAFLPWARPGEVAVTPEASAAHVELLALVALSAATGRPAGELLPDVEVQEMSGFVTEAFGRLNTLLELSHLRAVAASDPSDRLSMIALLLRGTQVLVRQTSYTEMAEETVVQLLNDNLVVRAALKTEVGFDAIDAFAVLSACHRVQQDRLNGRGAGFANSMNELMPQAHGEPTQALREAFRSAIGKLFEPDLEVATVSLAELVAESVSLRTPCRQLSTSSGWILAPQLRRRSSRRSPQVPTRCAPAR